MRRTTACARGAAPQAVLAHHGIDANQGTLTAELGTNATAGTRWWEMARNAEARGLAAGEGGSRRRPRAASRPG